jgi:hypothetical protein
MFDKVRAWLAEVPAKLKVLLGAWPTWAAIVTATLGAFGDEIVPLLPDHWAVQIGGFVATVLAGVAAVSAAVARVTPILFPEQKGLLRRDGSPTPAEAQRQLAEWAADQERAKVQVYPEPTAPPSRSWPEQRPTRRAWRRPGLW